jgi:chromosome segregation ATPase
MTMIDRLLQLLEFLKLILPEKEREIRKLKRRRDSYSARKEENDQQLKELQEQIRRLRRRAKALEGEFNSARGEERRIVQARIEQVFSELDTQEREEQIYHGNIKALAEVSARIKELIAKIIAGISSDDIEDLNLDLQQAEDELRERDAELARVHVRATKKVIRRKRQAEPAEPALASAETEAEPRIGRESKEEGQELPPAMKKRLADMETE